MERNTNSVMAISICRRLQFPATEPSIHTLRVFATKVLNRVVYVAADKAKYFLLSI